MSKWILLCLLLLSLVACTCNADQAVKVQIPKRFAFIQKLDSGYYIVGYVFKDTMTGDLIYITREKRFIVIRKKEDNNE